MSTQYDTLQAPYDAMREKSIALIERENVRTLINPYIANARVLELACGSGFYTAAFPTWGASSVVAVDISPVMVEAAQRLITAAFSAGAAGVGGIAAAQPSVEFHVGDCSRPTQFPGAPFDIVFGAWLLNYAPNHDALVDMFRNIALNLWPGGLFIGVTPPPAQDPVAIIKAESKIRPAPLGSGGLFFPHFEEVQGGAFLRKHADTEVGAVDFGCYHLKQEIYEAAAREGGLGGELKWELTNVPERYLKGDGKGGATIEELKSYAEVPNYGLLIVHK